MSKPRKNAARTGRPVSRLPRINIELLESRTLLAAHGFDFSPALIFSESANPHQADHANLSHDPSHVDADGQSATGIAMGGDNVRGDSESMPALQPQTVALPLLIETVREQPAGGIRVTLIETVVDLPLLPSAAPSDAWLGQPSVLHPQQPSTLPTTTTDTDGQPISTPDSTNISTNTVSATPSRQSIEIVMIGQIDSGKGVIVASVLRPGENGVTPGGTELPEHRGTTLLPNGAPLIQGAPATTASDSQASVAAPQPAAGTALPTAAPAAIPVLTPLAMRPAAVVSLSPAGSPGSAAPQVVTATGKYDAVVAGSATSQSSLAADSGHASGYSLGSIASIAPQISRDLPAMAGGAVVQLASGQPAATIVAKAGELLANPLAVQDSLPATIAYNFVRFDAAVFHDAASIFAADLASLTAPSPAAVHSHTRAWIITGVVLGFDAAFFAYWYHRSKREKQLKAALAAAS
jgi:hypothetical protein